MAPRAWLEPLDFVDGACGQRAIDSGMGLPFLGGPSAFLSARLIGPHPGHGDIVPSPEIPAAWQVLAAALAAAAPGWGGLVPALGPGAPLVMGIVNVTPDSFSGDGRAVDPDAAIAHGRALRAAGADILDIGGESTRPGAVPVGWEEECARVLPVVRALAAVAPLSIDTRHAPTMRLAVEAGAQMINDVSALRHDPDAMAAVAASGVPVALMHMRGDDPRRMQDDPRYADVGLEVADFLADRIEAAERGGIPRARVALDPGIGFGKTVAHNLVLLRRLPLLAGLGCPLLVGVSRKGFIGTLAAEAAPSRRVPGSLAAALQAVRRGARILRVHDVAETVQALQVWRACDAA
jgi:dihydropteroate synthase